MACKYCALVLSQKDTIKKKALTQRFPVLFHFKSFVDIFSFLMDILIFLRTFTDKSFWGKFLRTVRKFTDGWQPRRHLHFGISQ